MAVIGFSALAILFAAFAADIEFECGAAAFCLGAVLAVVILLSGKLMKLIVPAYICASLILCGALLVSCDMFSIKPAQKFYGTNAVVTGTVSGKSIDSEKSDGYVINIKSVDGERINASMYLYIANEAGLEPGNIIKFNAELDKPINNNGFAGRLYLKSENILFSSFLNPDKSVDIIDRNENSLTYRIYSIRRALKKSLSDNLSGDIGAAAEGMLLGDKSGLSDKAALNFSLTGVSHLFAVSGLHLSVWVLSFYEILKKLKVNRYLNAVLADIFIIFFMALTGFTASVCRAGIMLLSVMTGKLFDADSDPFNSLGLACAVLLIAKPYSAVSISLLLSFSATLGIISIFPFAEKRIFSNSVKERENKLTDAAKAVISVLIISLSANVFTLPVNAFIMGEISLLAPITNLLVSFAATVCMISAGIAGACGNIAFISRPASFVCEIFSKYILLITGALSKSSVTTLKLDNVFAKIAVIVIVSGVIVSLLLIQQTKKRVRVIALITAVSVILSSTSFIVYNHKRVTVDVFNVGDGIGTVISSGIKTIAIGCGGSDYYSSSSMAKALGSNAETLIIPDLNRWNSGGAQYLASKCRFSNVITGSDSYTYDLLFENAVYSDSFSLSPWKTASVSFVNEEEGCFAYCDFDNADILYIFSCDEDYSVPEQYSSADILIISYYPPKTLDLNNFGRIIISSTAPIKESIQNENPDVDFIGTDTYNKLTIDLKSGKIRGR